MEYILKINGRSMVDFKSSYTLRYLLESTLANYDKLTELEKQELCIKFDNEFSERYNMPKANFIFFNKEYTLDTRNIYFGDVSDLDSGIEFIARYFFEKRQQYQRICVTSRDKGSYSNDEYENIKIMFEKGPISKKSRYVSYRDSFDKYVLNNYNKVDALVFMFDEISECLNCIDIERVSKNMGFGNLIKVSRGIIKIQKYQDKFYKVFNESALKSKKVINSIVRYVKNDRFIMGEENFLFELSKFLEGNTETFDKYDVLLCFNPYVWDNLDDFERKQAVFMCNDLIAEIMRCDKLKKVEFSCGKNSYEFGDMEYVYVGSLENSCPIEIVHKLVYEYCFNKNYSDVLNLENKVKYDLLKEIAKCKELCENNCNMDSLKKYYFIRCVSKSASKLQIKIYDYITNNLIINGKKICMPMKKKDFVLDMYDVNNFVKRR